MKLFNNLSKKLETFEPIKAPLVTFYSCGPTVYDDSHVGHARSCLVWDLVYRYLKFRGYKVTWIRNITNIDDKIVNRSRELNTSPDQLSRAYTYEFWNDMAALNISWPDYEPRATDYLPQMFDFIKALINKGFAYETNGDVYFRVRKHENYGQLKGISLEDLEDGISRVDSNEKKEDQLDFALWKNFASEPETSFESPWGIGRPGWHLECSTMVHTILQELKLGETLDIHAGGDDLIFPHHENECAQSECHSSKPLAKYWLHNGMVMINGSKMSKSEGNFFTIKDLLKTYKANTIRYFALSTHYKKQINFSHEALQAAETGFDKLFEFIQPELQSLKLHKYFHKLDFKKADLNNALIEKFIEAMDNDFNSSQALALLFEYKKEENKKTIVYLLDLLGFNLNPQQNQTNTGSDKALTALDKAMNTILALRNQARSNKDFQTSDMIRDSLQGSGITIKDFRDKPSEWVLD